MNLFGRRMTPELLAAELLRGLESGEIVFADHEVSAPERAGALTDEAAKLAAVCAELRALVDRAASVLPPAPTGQPERAESLARLKDEISQVAKQLGAA